MARPVASGVKEDARLGLDRNIAVQRACGQGHDVSAFRLTWQSRATHVAELVGEAFGLGHLERSDVFAATQPRKLARLEEDVGCVARAGCLSTSRTMAVIEALWIALDLVRHRTT